MPGFVKTPAQEKAWKHAKQVVSRQRNKTEAAFSSRDLALANRIYHNMVESGVKAMAKASDQEVHVLLATVEYMLDRRRKKVRADKNEDLPEDVKALVEALSAVMAKGGQAIASLRKTKTTGMDVKASASLSGELHSLAEKLGKVLESVKES